jgi:pyruvate-formate lyase-activating enzyme
MYSYNDAVGLPQKPEFFYSYQKLLELLLESNIEYEYRTTVVKGLHTQQDIQSMAHYIR